MPESCNDGTDTGERLALAPWQEHKAKDILAGGLFSRLYIADVAEQCGISRSHFSRAFKQATGAHHGNGRCACASTAPASC
jgi:AraC family transcriptional regulator